MTQRYARFAGGAVIEVFDHDADPTSLFDPDWTWVPCPADTVQGATRAGEVWTNPEPPPVPEPWSPLLRKRLTPNEYVLQFTADELGNILLARADPGNSAELKMFFLSYFYITARPGLTEVDLDQPQVIQAVEGLALHDLIAAERVAGILAGRP